VHADATELLGEQSHVDPRGDRLATASCARREHLDLGVPRLLELLGHPVEVLLAFRVVPELGWQHAALAVAHDPRQHHATLPERVDLVILEALAPAAVLGEQRLPDSGSGTGSRSPTPDGLCTTMKYVSPSSPVSTGFLS